MALELTKTSATKIQQIERLKIAMDILESVKDQHTGVMVNFLTSIQDSISDVETSIQEGE